MERIVFIVSAILILFNSCNVIDSKPLVIGHRGAMGHEMENTIASIHKAMELGVDMIEIDVFKIRSGEVVVFHDTHVERLTNGTGQIETYDLAGIQQLTLIGDHKIPTLQDVLTCIDTTVPLNIELKGGSTAASVHRILKHYVEEKGWTWDNFIVSSFKWDELRAMRKHNSNVKIAVLTVEDPLEALTVAKVLKAVAIHPNYTTLTQENTATMQREGFAVHSWTVNAPNDIEKMKALGVNGIVTDYPERVR